MKLRGPHHHHPRAAPCHRLANLKSLPSSKFQPSQLQRQLFLRRHLRLLFSRRLSLRQQLSWHLQLFLRRQLSWHLQLFSPLLF